MRTGWIVAGRGIRIGPITTGPARLTRPRRSSSPIPSRIIQPVPLSQLAPAARVHVGPARRFFEGQHLVANRIGSRPDLRVRRTAAGRHGALHRARLEDGEPVMIEISRDAAFVAGALEAAPIVV